MARLNWLDITKEDVVRAIEKFLAYNPEYPEPRSTFLVYDGKKLPAKHIRGMAYTEHYGVEISKADFGGGQETVRFFERLGFEVAYSKPNAVTEVKSNEKSIQKVDKQVVEELDPIVERQAASAPIIKEESEAITTSGKISIPSKGVIEQKNALQLILNKMFDGDIVCEKTYLWLKTPTEIEGAYKKLFDALSSYRGNTAFAKKNVTLRCDFVCEGQKLIIEYDERQHFSEARRVSLEAYKDVEVLFDRELWIKACADIGAKDNAPANRDEVRAYYDSTRDIACAENGYKLVRIMHGQIDFEAEDAYEKLQEYLEKVLSKKGCAKEETVSTDQWVKAENIRVAMYLQTDELKNKKSFDKILPIMQNSDADIIVFPEYCYVPGITKVVSLDIALGEDREKVYDFCLELSRHIGKAVVFSSHDKYDTIFSVFANAEPLEGETEVNLYIKHTMCGSSCLDYENYPDLAGDIFDPIIYKGYLIGMTICYDCNHALFSRMYGMYGIDLIINSTGGNVVYDKWFKYNKARAIENSCYTLGTMGGDGQIANGLNYVFGFNKNGGQLEPVNLCGDSSKHNCPGGLYVYEVKDDEGQPEEDTSNQYETENKHWHFKFPEGNSEELLKNTDKIAEHIYRRKVEDLNVFFLLVEGEDILKPEVVQKLLYSNKLKKYSNRKYVIISRFDTLDERFFREKLSLILKVRSMENFCAVVLESENINKCYQCGKNRTAQVVKAVDGRWGIDLDRASGPEAIWKNKQGMRASWRKNYEWLVENAEKLYEEV